MRRLPRQDTGPPATRTSCASPVTSSTDDRSPMAQAMAWSSRITTISLEMVLPAVFGHWLDQRLGTWFVFVTLGAIAGMTLGLMHLIQMTKPTGQDASDRESADKRDSKP